MKPRKKRRTRREVQNPEAPKAFKQSNFAVPVGIYERAKQRRGVEAVLLAEHRANSDTGLMVLLLKLYGDGLIHVIPGQLIGRVKP